MTKTLPKSENGPRVLCQGKQDYVLSQNLDKKIFTLWLKSEGGYEKIATSNNPMKLYAKVVWN